MNKPPEAIETCSRLPKAGRFLSTFAIAISGNELPEWIELIPASKFSAVDGRGPFENSDPDSIIAASVAKMPQVGLVLDYDHSTDLAAPEGRPAPAAGWLKQFKVERGAIFARIEWTADAAEALKAKKYRYVSPVFEHSKDGKVEHILRAALTNNPALINLPALASAENPHLVSPWSEGRIKDASTPGEGKEASTRGEYQGTSRDSLKPPADRGEGRLGVSGGVARMAKQKEQKPKLSDVMATLEAAYPDAHPKKLMDAAACLMADDDDGDGAEDDDEHGDNDDMHAADDDPYAKETEEQTAARHADEMAKCTCDEEKAGMAKKHEEQKARFARRKQIAFEQHCGLELKGKPGGGDSKMISPSISSLIARHPMVVRMAREINSMRETQAKACATEKVDQAIREGRLIPSQREWAIEYCSTDVAGFDKFIGAQPVILQRGSDRTFSGRLGDAKSEGLTPKEQEICRNLGLPAMHSQYSVKAADGIIQTVTKADRYVELFTIAKTARLSTNVHLD